MRLATITRVNKLTRATPGSETGRAVILLGGNAFVRPGEALTIAGQGK